MKWAWRINPRKTLSYSDSLWSTDCGLSISCAGIHDFKRKEKTGAKIPPKKMVFEGFKRGFHYFGRFEKIRVVSLKFGWFLERKNNSGGFWFGWFWNPKYYTALYGSWFNSFHSACCSNHSDITWFRQVVKIASSSFEKKKKSKTSHINLNL